ncbi:Cytokine receptor common subunit beta-like protein [Aix galericulata]|nr:Cytokine receptor common subunit beta-like protein [Aix galericulata]
MLHLHLLVQPLPPQNLEVQNSSGDFFLTWTAAEGSQGLGNALEYEVTFKREWESWEKDASRLLSNTTRCHLSHLVPGSRYVARVRARAQQAKGFSGPFSEWSTDVSWETPEGQEPIQPRNLRCLFNGVNLLMCSWEVKKVITTSVIFGLFFRATPASAEEECSPVYEKALPHIPYVVQSCTIPVSNISSQSRYHVSVRTKAEEKLIEAYKNILSPLLLPVMLPVLIITLLIIASLSYKYFLRRKKLWEEKIPNPSKSLLIQSYLEKVNLGNWVTNSQLDFKYNLAEKMDQPSFLQVVDR